VKILALPQDANNPYQSLLYNEMIELGASVAYAGELTPSRTLNQLLLPIELAARRVTGTRIVHLHWTYGFALYGSSRSPAVGRASQYYFNSCLKVARMVGLRLAWTAHNVLPHTPVFPDDLAARRRLADAADLVIAHSQATLTELAALGITPRRSVIVPHGPYQVTSERGQLRAPAGAPGPRRFLFFGRVDEYKGVDVLLEAFSALPADLDARLAIVGECRDPSLRASLSELARLSPRPVELRFERISEDELSSVLESADVIVAPYRKSTTSGTALLALSHGRPLVIPDLPGLAELPGNAVVRYDGTPRGLATALAELIRADTETLGKMSLSGYDYASSVSWHSIARKTLEAMSLIDGNEPVAK
jgi:glycosyltransferase involved in cell wall biosynthesis